MTVNLSDFEELEGSPTIKLSRSTLVGKRIFKIAWAAWPTFVNEVWGYWQGTYYVAGSTFYGIPGMYPATIDVNPFQPDSPLESAISLDGFQTNYDYAKVIVDYAPFPLADPRQPEVPNGTFIVINGDIGAQYLTTRGRSWYWGSSGPNGPPPTNQVQDDVSPGILVPQETFSLSWHWVPAPPWTAMRQTAGSINGSTFMGFPKDSVMFLGATYEREYQINSTTLWKVDYKFSVKMVQSTTSSGTYYGHNYFWNPDTAASADNWQELSTINGMLPFQEANFNNLFSFGS